MVLPLHDSELARLVEIGDEHAATVLDGKYRPRLESIARKSGVPVEDCRDLAQDVLAAAMLQIRNGAFRAESTVGTWLRGILKTKIADYWRRSQRNPLRMVAREDSYDEPATADLVAKNTDPTVQIGVRQALGRMPALHRLVLILNQFGGVTTAEIAVRLGRPQGTIGRILVEAKERFRRHLRDEDSPPNQRLLER
jgi:RNA polymerase sigma-70 factor, ECF subfamily